MNSLFFSYACLRFFISALYYFHIGLFDGRKHGLLILFIFFLRFLHSLLMADFTCAIQQLPVAGRQNRVKLLYIQEI